MFCNEFKYVKINFKNFNTFCDNECLLLKVKRINILNTILSEENKIFFPLHNNRMYYLLVFYIL